MRYTHSIEHGQSSVNFSYAHLSLKETIALMYDVKKGLLVILSKIKNYKKLT